MNGIREVKDALAFGTSRVSAAVLSAHFFIHKSAITKSGRMVPQFKSLELEYHIKGNFCRVVTIFANGFDFTNHDTLEGLYLGQKVKLTRHLNLDNLNLEERLRGYQAKELKGIPVSPGYAFGKVLIWENRGREHKIDEVKIEDHEVENELNKFNRVKTEVTEELWKKRRELQDKNLEQLYSFLQMVLADSTAQGPTTIITGLINEKRVNANTAIRIGINRLIAVFMMIREQNPQIGNKIYDFKYLEQLMLKALGEGNYQEMDYAAEKDKIILVANFPPIFEISDVPFILGRPVEILGIVAEEGGQSDHGAIVAQNLGIPAVFGVTSVTNITRNGDNIFIDGMSGKVEVNPDVKKQVEYTKLRRGYNLCIREINSKIKSELLSTDFRVFANILSPEEIMISKLNSAQGVGLYRIEFGIAGLRGLPQKEEEALPGIKILSRGFTNFPIIVRTFDFGGTDKPIPAFLNVPEQKDPSLGHKGVSLYDTNYICEELFRRQIRAILKASRKNPGLAIMIPMVRVIKEFVWAKEAINEEKRNIEGSNKNIQIGTMIETPSAVSYASELAKHADFFSIGSNDLFQYQFAICRNNQSLASVADPFDFSFVSSIKSVIDAGHKKPIPVCLCGGIASNPLFELLLYGLGIDSISVSPSFVMRSIYLLQGVKRRLVEELVENVISQGILVSDSQGSPRNKFKKYLFDNGEKYLGKKMAKEIEDRIELIERTLLF